MKKAATIFLRFTLVAMAIAMLGVCFGATYEVIIKWKPERYMDIVLLAVIYTAAGPYFITLFQSAKLLGFIDRGLVFSEQSVKALTVIIKSTLALFAICTIGGLPFFYKIADIEDAPGVMIIGLVIAGAALAIAVFAYVLRWLLGEAIMFNERSEML